jgi:perosamine synthetase
VSLGRRQPPVSSPIGATALVAAAVAAGRAATTRGLVTEIELLRSILAGRFHAPAVALTDSGTSALALAFAIMLPRGGTVALPAYGCVDLVAAARYGGLRVRLYDIDPATLSPDLDSLRRALGRGVDVAVVAHFYGFAADIEGARAVASAAAVPIIEDAAQHAGGQLAGRPLGAFGPLTVLSFGRGKGTTGGRGGALLATADAGASMVTAVTTAGASQWGVPGGLGDLTRAAAQWLLGRPSLYSLPASVPGLRLGETIYHPAHEPESLSRAAAVLVARAFGRLDADREVRARRANDLMARLEAWAAAGAPD